MDMQGEQRSQQSARQAGKGTAPAGEGDVCLSLNPRFDGQINSQALMAGAGPDAVKELLKSGEDPGQEDEVG